MSLANHIKSADFKTEKHAPEIEFNHAKAGEAFDVIVSVGKEIAHPNTTEHFINYLTLFFVPEGEAKVVNLGQAFFNAHAESAAGANQGPAHTEPVACFRVKLQKPGKFIATSYCNIHGLWETEKEVKF